MDLIKLNGYIPPNPSTYDVSLSDINGEESTTEDGYSFIESIRKDIPTIKVGWTNITQDIAQNITRITANDKINVDYFYGDMASCEMTVSERALKLKLVESDKSYWDLSFTLKG